MKQSGSLEMSSHGDFWLSQASDNNISPGGEDHEGFDIGLVLRLLCGPSVCEIGCGFGRHAMSFPDYVGLDVNFGRIAFCKQRYPGKDFNTVGFDGPYPEAECYLFCSTLLHVKDHDLPAIARRVKGTRVVICEVMNPERRDGKVNFHRAPEGYNVFGTPAKYSLPYERYPDTFTFLVFDA